MTSTVLLLPREGLQHLVSPNAGTFGDIKFKRSLSDDLILVSMIRTGGVGHPLSLSPKLIR
jgi:hypothetical protein